MKYLVGNRGSGVTDSILLEASKMNGTVIVPSVVQKTAYEERCKEYGIKCPELFTIDEVIGNIRRERSSYNRGLNLSEKMIFIDGLNELLKRLALSNVVTAGDTIDGTWISKQSQLEGWRAKND